MDQSLPHPSIIRPLVYLGAVLQCDSPILEAIYHTAARVITYDWMSGYRSTHPLLHSTMKTVLDTHWHCTTHPLSPIWDRCDYILRGQENGRLFTLRGDYTLRPSTGILYLERFHETADAKLCLEVRAEKKELWRLKVVIYNITEKVQRFPHEDWLRVATLEQQLQCAVEKYWLYVR